MFYRLKKTGIMLIIFIFAITLSACDDSDVQQFQADFKSSLALRMNQNLEFAKRLNSNGIITDSELSKVEEILKQRQNDFELQMSEDFSEYKPDASGNVKVNSAFTSSIIGAQLYDYNAIKNYYERNGLDNPPNVLYSKEGTEIPLVIDKRGGIIAKGTGSSYQEGTLQGDDWKDTNVAKESQLWAHFISNFLAKNGSIRYSGPIDLVGDTITGNFENRLQCEIYALDWSKVQGHSIDEVIDCIAEATGNKIGLDENIAVDSNGKPVALMTGKLNAFFSDTGEKLSDLIDGEANFSLTRDTVIYDGDNCTRSKYNNQLGYDLQVCQFDNLPVLTVRLHEFAPEAIDLAEELFGTSSSRYVLTMDAGHARVYLMEYPVSYIDYFTNLSNEDIEDSNKRAEYVSGHLKESGIGINLYTKKIIKYDKDSDGDWLGIGEEVDGMFDSNSSYLTIDGARNISEDSMSSFAFAGNKAINLKLSTSTKKFQLSNIVTANIVLRDYLEATYAPGYSTESNLVVFGRKIRLNIDPKNVHEKKSGYSYYTRIWFKREENMGFYVDKQGNKSANSPIIKPTDLIDIPDIINNNEITALVTKSQIVDEHIANKVVRNATDENKNLQKTTNDLKKTVKGAPTANIHATAMFPGEKIGIDDMLEDKSTKQRFYVLATDKGIFDSGLFASWINVSDPNASLDWWNKYLSDNEFLYKVDHADVNEFLLNNYTYELSKAGVITVDLDTIAFIQDEMDERHDKETVELMRTIFIILGWLLICYGLLLLAAWGIDVNVDLGFGLLSTLTLGHWTAVKDDSGVPDDVIQANGYITGTRMWINVFILTAVGIILITGNVFNIVIKLITTIGSVASTIQKMITGK